MAGVSKQMTQQQFILLMINFLLLIWQIGSVSNNINRVNASIKEIKFDLYKLRERIGDNNNTILSQIRDKMK